MGAFSRVLGREQTGAAGPDELLARARKGDAQSREQLIRRFQPLVARVAARVTGRYVRMGEDDEASVCLIAFNEAIDSYDPARGIAFVTFAEIVMRRRLIDHFRRQSARSETPFSALEEEDEEGNVQHTAEREQALAEHARRIEASERREEIRRYAELLRGYGISFTELPDVAPKHEDARRRAIEVAELVAGRDEWAAHLRRTGELPLKALEAAARVSRKTLERQRKFIIAVALILMEDLVYLRSYIGR